MAMLRALSTFSVLVAAMLAGCTEEAARDQDIPQGNLDLGQGTAGIQGQVVDTEFQPIEGATVAVTGVDPLRTDLTGGFQILGLAPGEYVVEAKAPGFTSASRTVALVEGGVERVEFILEKLASTQPYLEVLNFRGYSVCDEAYYAGSAPGEAGSPCTVLMGKKPENRWVVPVAGSWRFMVSELVWDAQLGGTSDSMRLVHSRNESCSSGDPCYGLVYANYYARVEAEPGKTELVEYYDPYSDLRGPPYPEGAFNLTVFVNWIGYLREFTGPTCDYWTPVLLNSYYKPGCLGVGISTGIPFDLWVTVFHYEGPPRGACCPSADYSAVPDN